MPLYYFNFKNKRKIFLGNGGSLFLGTIISMYIFYVLSDDFYFINKINLNKTLFSVLILLYPLTDLLRIFIVRLKNNKLPFYPDKNHLHHLALQTFKKKQWLVVIVIQLSELLLFLLIIFIYKMFR